MSVSSGLNRAGILTGLVAVVLVAAALVVRPDGSSDSATAPASDTLTAIRSATPSAALDVVSTTRLGAPVEVSRRLLESSPTVVLADATDPAAQQIAITSASTLGVPVLLDTPEAPAEIDRLGATTVLTFGRVAAVPGATAVPVDEAQAAAEIDRRREAAGQRSAATADAIVMTRSASSNAAAVATARAAGAHVLEVPDADPRTDSEAARYLAEHPDHPVIALGSSFAHVAYPLDVVRKGIEQPAGGYLALGGKTTYTAMYGHPGAPQLGVLGEQGVQASIKRVERLVRKYQRAAPDAEFVPTFEIIATVASASAGKDKNYSTETPVAELLPLVDAAEKAGIYVILDLQPGRTDFLTQAKKYRSLLERPHVGLAIDPEWRLTKKQKHLVQIGSVTADEINRTGDWLADLTKSKSLPQKIFVLHQFSSSMIKHRGRLDTSRPELATVIHVDGSGPQGAKQGTWHHLRAKAPRGVGWGWKNFVDEDSPMLTAQQTWRQVKPHPDLITYQ
ncbi:hypothetical protein [Aeromicrobium wangtongii]|uniref:Cell wall-binding repeat-containing protein n=1 Tax=Aeromicrobium wangtongii TaxID=2969247 RepID=A0ABY5MAJ3_9ACTN|nr:hypothetical protein [Aeromicrobium wangtongii]MCD9199332.1 hypothetical protein [Aeromicrobium wangtongii]UUP13693.1 hypothetical protein NQV15_17860 [Aeromicrobium wangtongii]